MRSPCGTTWIPIALVLSLPLCATPARAQPAIVQWSPDAGGQAGSDHFSLRGSIGQPDAGTLSGGEFTLRGGFWAGPATIGCDSTDFNMDGLFPDTADIEDFLSVFSGGACSTGMCADIDFNNDGLYPDSLDIESFLSVFSGGPCL